MKKTSRAIAILPALIGLFLFVAGCSDQTTRTGAPPETVRDVKTVIAQRASLPSFYEAVGTVRATQSAQVAAQTTGNIVRMNVREGDPVSRGQVLAVLDDSQTQAALDRAVASQRASLQEITAAEAEYSLAESTLKRYQVLQEKKSISPHEFEEVSARNQAAKARRDMAQAGNAGADAAVVQTRTSQGYTQVRAPFAGVVMSKLAETGNLATPGTPLFIVEDTNSFRLEVTVDERGIGVVHLGASVPVAIDALASTPLTGKVIQVLPAVDAASRSFVVKVELPRSDVIRTGIFGRAQFPSGTRDGISVPASAVVRRGSMQAVYVIGSDQLASLRYVTLGTQGSANVEVLSGLENGDRVVANPGERELNGKKIEVR